MKRSSGEKGFTLIELLLVVVVMGLMLAIIVPRGQRASVDAKYSSVRQNGTEVAALGLDWVEQMINASDDGGNSSSTSAAYLDSLCGHTAANSTGSVQGAWIADINDNNWNFNAGATPANRITVVGREVGGASGASANPETTVQGIIDPGKEPRNPFNGLSVFASVNYSADNPIPGALAAGVQEDATRAGLWRYYALVFQGTDSTDTDADPDAVTDEAGFHGGMGVISLAGLRNGIFMARVAP